MNRVAIHFVLGLGVSLVALGAVMPESAHAVYKYDYSQDPSGKVQIIEGETIRNASPPLPGASGERISLGMSPVPAGAMQTSDIAALISRCNRKLAPEEVASMSQTIHLLSDNYNLDPRLLASLVAVESSFRPAAVSSSGAIGLGQLKPATAQWLGVSNPWDPAQNLQGVARYLRYLLNRYNGSVQHALAAYYQGQGTIDRKGIDSGAQYYISKVNRMFNGAF